MYSVVLLIPVSLHEQAEQISELMGYGSPAYTVPLSGNGQNPATHIGLHTWASQEFIDLLNSDTMPEKLVEAGFNQKDYNDVMNSLISSVSSDSTNHFIKVLSDNNLLNIISEE